MKTSNRISQGKKAREITSYLELEGGLSRLQHKNDNRNAKTESQIITKKF